MKNWMKNSNKYLKNKKNNFIKKKKVFTWKYFGKVFENWIKKNENWKKWKWKNDIKMIIKLIIIKINTIVIKK